MVDITLLRKLTEKSKFGFGKYNNLAVREVLNLQHPQYIRWCYFNLDKISFIEDILNEVKIPKEYRIEKPGKNPELGKKLDEEVWNNMWGLTRHINEKVRRKERKRNLCRYNARDSLKYSKGAMQRINHGHR